MSAQSHFRASCSFVRTMTDKDNTSCDQYEQEFHTTRSFVAYLTTSQRQLYPTIKLTSGFSVTSSGVGTGGSGGSMNRGRRAPGNPSSGATEKF